MGSTFVQQTKLFLKKFPLIDNYLISQEFKVELDLIRGIQQSANSHPSILHFSVNKSATQYVKSIIRRCSEANHLTNVGIHDYAFKSKSNFPYLNELSAEEFQEFQHIFRPEGYTYSVFGGMIDGFQNLEQYLVVLMVRDPRDVIVSGYYSVGHSHPEPAYGTTKHANFLKDRAFAQTSTVDEYAIAQCDKIYSIYDRYRQLLLDRHSNVYITKYEDMVTDFESWLRSLLGYCQLDISDELCTQLVGENSRLRPSSENVKKHIRKGKAGDYKEKLKVETIDYIESKLSPLFKAYGYT